MRPDEIAEVIAFRDKASVRRQSFRERVRRCLYRLFGILLMVYFLGLMLAGIVVVVKGWWK